MSARGQPEDTRQRGGLVAILDSWEVHASEGPETTQVSKTEWGHFWDQHQAVVQESGFLTARSEGYITAKIRVALLSGNCALERVLQRTPGCA